MSAEMLAEKFNRLTSIAGWSPTKARDLIPQVMTLDKAANLDGLLRFF
jgi:hypothetical protein